MSIQALTWVLAQPAEDLPATPRAVMFALANHADHTDGHCWPSIETIAKEAGMGERTASRYLAALVRNGFIEKRQKNDKGHFRANDFWLLFDRPPGKWQFYDPKKDDPADEMADGSPDIENNRPPTLADGRPPTVADAIYEPSDSEPSESEVGEGAPISPPAKPIGFDPNKRRHAMERQKAADEARKAKSIPVIRGTEPWNAWVARGHPNSLFTKIQMPDGRRDFGWYFTTLWPPPQSESAVEPKKLNTG